MRPTCDRGSIRNPVRGDVDYHSYFCNEMSPSSLVGHIPEAGGRQRLQAYRHGIAFLSETSQDLPSRYVVVAYKCKPQCDIRRTLRVRLTCIITISRMTLEDICECLHRTSDTSRRRPLQSK